MMSLLNPLPEEAAQWPGQPGISEGAAIKAQTDSLMKWLESERAKSAAMGMWNDETGLPTQKGLMNGLGQYGDALVAGTSAPGRPGIRAFHGSPHDFEKFDASKIGTGEGAQAYGRGLYFAENEGVARSYKGAGPAANSQLDAINKQMSQLSKQMDKYSSGQYGKFNDPRGYELKAEYDALMDQRANLGHMYEVGINANPEHFLDWDKPLSEQSSQVREILRAQPEIQQMMQSQAKLLGDKALNPSGQSMYAAMTGWKRGVDLSPSAESAAQAGQRLKEAGIPGISYLDQGSRAAGEGSRNHVVFDPETIEILRKYGIAGLMAGGAAAAKSNDQ